MSRPAWHAHLSREGRDTLWLLSVLLLAIAPHVDNLPWWCTAGTMAAIAWRAQLAWRDAPTPPRWVLIVALGVALAITLLTYRSIFGREAGMTLVTVLAGLKTLELRARRDAFVVTALGFFIILTQFLYSQGLGTAVLMLCVLIGLLSSLVLAQRPTGRPAIASAIGAATRGLALGIPLMVLLYLFFPRFGPLWTAPGGQAARSGLSEEMALGEVAELALDDSVAMRVRFDGEAPPPSAMYFRGPTLDRFDGRQWLPGRPWAPERPAERDPRIGTTWRYQITLEPSKLRIVPLLDGTHHAEPAPPQTEPRLRRQGPTWLAARPLSGRTQFDAEANPVSTQAAIRDAEHLHEWLQLPPGLNPRTQAWAARLRQQHAQASAPELAQAVLAHIRQAGYEYTLVPGLPPEDDAQRQHLIDRFWLDERSGFCEHFAAAFVVVMRAMGVPARVVTGFQGAELNPVDGLFVVRNSDAHAWAEYWEDNRGWVRIDPTAAVAPERVDRTRPALRPGTALPGPLGELNPAAWGQLRAYMDAVNHRWNVWVLSYSRGQQSALLQDWGIPALQWQDLLRLSVLVIGCAGLAGLLWLWWDQPRKRLDAWQRDMRRLHRWLTDAGVPPPAGLPAPAPALSWADQLTRIQHPAAAPLNRLLHALDALRYGPTMPPGATRERRRALMREIHSLIRSTVRRGHARRTQAH